MFTATASTTTPSPKAPLPAKATPTAEDSSHNQPSSEIWLPIRENTIATIPAPTEHPAPSSTASSTTLLPTPRIIMHPQEWLGMVLAY